MPGGPSAARDWLVLAVALILVVVGVEGLLRTAIWLGNALGTPSFLWGATVVAAATSLPDALISIKSARRGEGEVSLGNVLGSNIFDLLVAVPLAVLIVGGTAVDFAVAAPLIGFLTLATIVLFAFLRTRLQLTRVEGVILLACYVAFVVWLGLETANVTGWISYRRGLWPSQEPVRPASVAVHPVEHERLDLLPRQRLRGSSSTAWPEPA